MADQDETDRAEAIISRIRGNPELQERMREDPVSTLREVGMNDAEIADLLGGEELQAMGGTADLQPGDERPDPLLTSDSKFGQQFIRLMMRRCSTSDEEETGTSCG